MEMQYAMPSSSGRSDGPLVLLVEDNEANARLVREMLRANGYRINHVRDGQLGVDAVRDVRPDLILMDLQLPRLDGLSATRIIKADPTTADIPILAFTAHALDEHRERMLAAGCCGYVTKPISYRAFVDTIAGALNSCRRAT
jgi:two-component system cell cycle response regulator DivK